MIPARRRMTPVAASVDGRLTVSFMVRGCGRAAGPARQAQRLLRTPRRGRHRLFLHRSDVPRHGGDRGRSADDQRIYHRRRQRPALAARERRRLSISAMLRGSARGHAKARCSAAAAGPRRSAASGPSCSAQIMRPAMAPVDRTVIHAAPERSGAAGPRVSVAVVTYNAEATLEATLTNIWRKPIRIWNWWSSTVPRLMAPGPSSSDIATASAPWSARPITAPIAR